MVDYNNNISAIESIHQALGDLGKGVVYIGGICVPFYVDDPGMISFRQTKDVDVAIKVYTLSEFYAFQERLLDKGFKNDITAKAPLVRFTYGDLILDAIPDDASIVGYKYSPWFKEGRRHIFKRGLPSGEEINLLPLAYYFATKIEASKSKGAEIYLDHDLEDIITIIDGRDSIVEILDFEPKVRDFVSDHFKDLLSDSDFNYFLPSILGYEMSVRQRKDEVVSKMKEICP